MTAPLFTMIGLPVTAYALAMSLGLAVLCLWLMLSAKKAGLPQARTEWFLLLALSLGLLLARLVYVLVRIYFFLDRPDGLAFRIWQGGTALWGALLGFLLAGWLSARVTRTKAAPWLDFLTPYGLLAIALGRFCEGLSGQGFGQEAPPGLGFFPVSVVNEWGVWRFAVFLLSGVLALVFAFAAAKAPLRRPGDRLRLGLSLFCAAQVWLESLREDQFLCWGFVKAAQLFSVLILFYLLLEGLFFRGGSFTWPRHIALALFTLCVAVIIAMEFALDKTTININLIYGIMFLGCLGLGWLSAGASLKGECCS